MEIAIIDNHNNFNKTLANVFEQLEHYNLKIHYYSCVNEMKKARITFQLIFLEETQAHIIFAKVSMNNNIIFITDENKDIKNSFDLNILAYIKRDYLIREYKEIIECIIKEILNDGIIIFKINGTLEKFYLDEIIYFQYLGEKMVGFVYRKQSYLIKNSTLKDIKEKINNRFMYIDRNTLVNVLQIEKIQGKEIKLKGINQYFNISKRRIGTVKKNFKASVH